MLRVLGAAAAGLSSEFCLALVVPRIRGREVEDLEVGRLAGSVSLGSSPVLCCASRVSFVLAMSQVETFCVKQ